MEVTIRIPSFAEALSHWKWGLLAALVLALALTWGHEGSQRAEASSVTAASARDHTCAVTTVSGLKCWGNNLDGQVGDGTTTDRTTPVDVLPSGVVAVAAGVGHTCALTTAGGLKCWGSNGNGQLGDGTTTQRLTPVDVFSSGVAAVTAGYDHTCVLTTTGGVKCWGSNSNGQLGDGTLTQRLTPVDVSGLSVGVVAIDAGGWHTCAVTATAGGVKCWGYGFWGQIGDGTTTFNQTTPSEVCATGATPPCTAGNSNILTGVAAVTGGGELSCALMTAGGIKCWGRNSFGQLGDGQACGASICTTPVDVSGLGSGVAAMTAGHVHACAVTTAGGLKCWGSNLTGQVGDGTTTDRTTPVDVTGLTTGVAAVAAGAGHTCAVTTAGGLKCWGSNLDGQVGDGTTTQRLTPVNVTTGAKPQINIINLGQYALPKACFDVRNSSQTSLFTICDNDFLGPPENDAACLPSGVCSDVNSAPGAVGVLVVAGNYRVVETTVPPNHVAVTGKQACDATTIACSVTYTNTPNTRPWFPWDTAGGPGVTPDGKITVVDILAVVQKFAQEKPLP